MISNLVTGYFVQRKGWNAWEDVPDYILEHAGHKPNPYIDINHAQAALDAAEAFHDERFRLVARPIATTETKQ